MNNLDLNTLLQGLISLIIHIKTNQINNNYGIRQNLLNKLVSLEQEMVTPSLLPIFDYLIGKNQNYNKSILSKVRITFKLISSQTNSVQGVQIWELQVKNNRALKIKNNKSPNKTIETLKQFLQNIIQTSHLLPKWSNYLNIKNQKISKYQFTYQINSYNIPKIHSFGQNKTQINATFNEDDIICSVYFKEPIILQIQNFVQQNKKQRKQSIQTLGSTCQLQEQKHKKISFYEYYDQQNEVTFISSDSFSFGQKNKIANIIFDDQEESDDQFELIINEQDKRLSQFKQKLKLFSNIAFEDF